MGEPSEGFLVGRIIAKTPPSRVPSRIPIRVLNHLEEEGGRVSLVARFDNADFLNLSSFLNLGVLQSPLEKVESVSL